MSLKTKQLNADLADGITTQGLLKDGLHGTFAATFTDISGDITARLQQSVDGDAWADVPNSETTLTTADTERLWTDNIMPRGTMVRLVIDNPGHNTGTLVAIKLLSNE